MVMFPSLQSLLLAQSRFRRCVKLWDASGQWQGFFKLSGATKVFNFPAMLGQDAGPEIRRAGFECVRGLP